MTDKIKKLLKNGPNMRRENLRALAKAWMKAHDALEEMDRAMLKLCSDTRKHDSWPDSDRPQDDKTR